MRRAATSRRQQAGERREQILDAAMEVFACKGFEGATVRDIARRIGVTEGLLYHYFESKDDLLNACWKERSFNAKIEEIIARSEGVPVQEVLREMLRTFLDTLRSHGASVRLMAVEVLHRGECAKDFAERAQENRRVIGGFLRERQRTGEIRENANLEIVADLLMGSGHAMFLIFGNQPDDGWNPVADGLIQHGIDTIVFGLAGSGVPSACSRQSTDLAT